jgi:putative hemolysin
MQIDIRWARSEADLQDAQRLRHRVFAVEMGARLAPPAGTTEGLDADRFDAFCDHLLVRAHGAGLPETGMAVGTYRVMGPAEAQAAGGYYMDTEFDLARIALVLSGAAELGRSCVHPDWRAGGVILAMWSALAGYMQHRGLHTMIGCASMSLADGGQSAQEVWRCLRETHMADAPWEVRARVALPAARATTEVQTTAGGRRDIPPLIRGYLRCGARILGAPAWDAAFNTADLPMMMRMEEMEARYRSHLLRSASGAQSQVGCRCCPSSPRSNACEALRPTSVRAKA